MALEEGVSRLAARVKPCPPPLPLRSVQRAAQHGVLRTNTVSAVLRPKDGEGAFNG